MSNKLKCVEHNRRVIVTLNNVWHRTGDNSICSKRDPKLQFHGKEFPASYMDDIDSFYRFITRKVW